MEIKEKNIWIRIKRRKQKRKQQSSKKKNNLQSIICFTHSSKLLKKFSFHNTKLIESNFLKEKKELKIDHYVVFYNSANTDCFFSRISYSLSLKKKNW